jgi:hypothetical protein
MKRFFHRRKAGGCRYDGQPRRPFLVSWVYIDPNSQRLAPSGGSAVIEAEDFFRASALALARRPPDAQQQPCLPGSGMCVGCLERFLADMEKLEKESVPLYHAYLLFHISGIDPAAVWTEHEPDLEKSTPIIVAGKSPAEAMAYAQQNILGQRGHAYHALSLKEVRSICASAI